MQETSSKPERNEPSGKIVSTLNAIQVARLGKLITKFNMREKKLVYRNAQIEFDESLPIWLNCLEKSGTSAPKIRRHAQKRAINTGKGYNRQFSPEFAAIVDEHSALDIFQAACKLLPGFEAATARRFKERIPSFVAKRAPAPVPYDGTEPPLIFEPPMFERRKILPSALYNALAIGSTGSGKTASFVLPTLFSMLAYRVAGGLVASVLAVDPKVELLDGIKDKLTALGELERLVVVGQCDPISYFEDNDGLSVGDRFDKAKSFVTVSSTRSDDNRWQAFAEQLILSFLKDDQQFANVCQLPLLESVAALVTGEAQYLERNQWVALRKLLLLGMEDQLNLRHISDVYDALTLGVGMTKMDRPFARYCSIKDSDQYFYNARGALIVVDGLGSADIEPFMDLSVRRHLKKEKRTDVAALIERGAVLVFQPRQTATDDLVGRALKSLFFRCVMERENMLRPIGYFCDEFQRFITYDESGEHAFLDRCRAYRVNCTLATQSMAALLAATKGALNASSSLDSILVNTPTKLCFRTTDEAAVDTMKSFIPRDPRGEQHVLTFRPPSSLLTGECYFAFGHEWGRTRYQLAPRAAHLNASKN